MTAGRHARPIDATDSVEQEPTPTVYFRAGRRRAVVTDDATVLRADGQAV